MGTTLHAPRPWPHITAALRGPGPHRVAIAYLDTTAPELLPLRAGDQLIVNAARPAVRAHATSPTALAHFGSYHSRPCAVRRGDRLVPADRSLLLYYQNRLEGYGLEAALGKRPALSKDHRALAPSR